MAFAPDETAQSYFEGEFFRRITSDDGAKKREKPLALLATLEARYGCAFPAELRKLVELVETYDLSAVCVGEWQHMSDALAPIDDEKNVFVQAVALDQKHYLGTAFAELLCNLVPIGHARNGDVYLAYVDALAADRCEVFLWDHEERTLSVIADCISSLAYLTYLYEVDAGHVEVEGDVLDVLKAGFAHIEKRVSPSWHYRSTCKNAGVAPRYESTTAGEFLFARGDWVLALVRGGGDEVAAEAKAHFIEPLERWHAANSFEAARQGPRFARSPMSVYWLFYNYFFDDMPNVNVAVSALAESTSRFARDAAELFAQLAHAADAKPEPKAKVKLGKITDLVALKKLFLAAETGGARTERERREKEAAEAERARAFAAADAIAASATPEAIEAAAREHAATPAMVERLFDHLRVVDVEVDRTMKRLDVLADSGRYREHKLVNTWLQAHGSPRVVPLLVARGAKATLGLFEPRPAEATHTAPPATRETFGVLRTAPSRNTLHVLTTCGTEAHLELLDELLRERRGNSKYIVFERTMREALASHLGKPVALDVVRRALGLTYSDRERTSVLHRVALRVLAAHAPAEEVRRTALRFLTWDIAEVRRDARAVLLALGETDKTRIVDSLDAEATYSEGGAPALAALLRDPWAYPKVAIVTVAEQKGVGAEIAADAVAAFEATYFPFAEGYGYYSGTYDVMLRTAEAIARLPGADVDAFLRKLITSPSALLSPVVSDAALRERGRTAGSLERVLSRGALEVGMFRAPSFVLGGTIHGLALAGSTIVAGGNQSSSFFDAEGTAVPLPDEVRVGWAYDADVDPSGNRVALGYHGCHLVVLDVAGQEIVGRMRLGGVPSGIRKVKWSPSGRYLATASDDDSVRVIDTTTFTEVMRHDEPYDVNGVAWLDEEHIVFITDNHVGLVARTGGEPKRLDGGGADVIVFRDVVIATTTKHGIAWIDPAKMEVIKTLAVKGASRVRISPDGAALWATVWEGSEAGLVRWSLPDGSATQVIATEPMFALALDSRTGDVVCGGDAGRIDRVRASGEVVPAPMASHLGAIVSLTREHARGTLLAVDAGNRALRWILSAGAATAPWGELDPSRAPKTAHVLPDDDLVVGAYAGVARHGRDGLVWFFATQRCEATIVMGSHVIAGSGGNLVWLDVATGKEVASVHAGAKSSWLHFMFAVDDDSFLVAGYDDPKLQRFSAREQTAKASATLDRRHEDGRFSRAYSMTFAPRAKHLYVAYWNETIDVLDAMTLERLLTYDVDHSYGLLAVDDDERWLVAATGPIVDVIDLDSGVVVAQRVLGAEITSVTFVGPRDVMLGLKSGALARATWPAA